MNIWQRSGNGDHKPHPPQKPHPDNYFPNRNNYLYLVKYEQ